MFRSVSRRALLAVTFVMVQFVAWQWQSVLSASIITVYQLADCSDDGGGVDMGVEASYNGVPGSVKTVYHQMNLTGRSCLPLALGIGTNVFGTALYDCQYDQYSGLSTIIVLNWPTTLTGPPMNPTCNTSLAFLAQQDTVTASWIQHSGFVNGQCTRLHEGSYGFGNFEGDDNPVYARINCSMMIPNYEHVRQVPNLPVNPLLARLLAATPASSTFLPLPPSSSTLPLSLTTSSSTSPPPAQTTQATLITSVSFASASSGALATSSSPLQAAATQIANSAASSYTLPLYHTVTVAAMTLVLFVAATVA